AVRARLPCLQSHGRLCYRPDYECTTPVNGHGLVRRQDMKRLEKPADEPQEKKPNGLPATLISDLEAYRLQIAQVEMAKHRLAALDLLVFKVACNAFAAPHILTGPDVRFIGHSPMVKEQTGAAHAIKATAKALPLAWLKPRSEAERFRAFTGLSDK